MRSIARPIADALLVAVFLGTAGPRQAHAQIIGPPAMRYTLTDGSVVVGSPVAEDAESVTVQAAIGLVRLKRSQIASVMPAAPPAPSPQPVLIMAPAPQVVKAPAPPRRSTQGLRLVFSGASAFITAYGMTVLVAAVASRLNDPFAPLGYVPFAGPLMWWSALAGRSVGLTLAIVDTVVQSLGVLCIVLGAVEMATENAAGDGVSLVPVLDGHGGRFALVGRW